MKRASLLDKVVAARSEAYREAKASYRWVRSRGTWLCTGGPGGQVGPRPEAACPTWDGTLREIRRVVADVVAKHPDVDRVYLAGGYDGADTFDALWTDFNYEPWASAWDVPVWTREFGFVP